MNYKQLVILINNLPKRIIILPKRIIICIVLVGFLFIDFFLKINKFDFFDSKAPEIPEYKLSDEGIQTFYQNYVPHINEKGQFQKKNDEQSFFPLALYYVDLGKHGKGWQINNLNDNLSRDTLPEVQDAHFNTIYSAWWTPTREELEYISHYNLKVIANIRDSVFASVKNKDWEILKKDISMLNSFPNVLAIHLFDEYFQFGKPLFSANEPVNINHWKKAYLIIKSIVKDKVVFPNAIGGWHGGCGLKLDDNYVSYKDISDVVNIDHYTIATSSTASLADFTSVLDKVRNDCQQKGLFDRKPFFVIIQAFRETYDPRWTVRPTKEQLRAEMYASIIHGASGIWLFAQHTPWLLTPDSVVPWNQDHSQFGGISPQVTPELWQEVKKTNEEIEKNKQIFFSPTATEKYHLYIGKNNKVSGAPIHSLLKNSEEKNVKYLLSINIVQNDIKSVRFVFDKQIDKVESVINNLPIKVNENWIESDFLGYQANIYKIYFK